MTHDVKHFLDTASQCEILRMRATMCFTPFEPKQPIVNREFRVETPALQHPKHIQRCCFASLCKSVVTAGPRDASTVKQTAMDAASQSDATAAACTVPVDLFQDRSDSMHETAGCAGSGFCWSHVPVSTGSENCLSHWASCSRTVVCESGEACFTRDALCAASCASQVRVRWYCPGTVQGALCCRAVNGHCIHMQVKCVAVQVNEFCFPQQRCGVPDDRDQKK